MQIHLSFCHCYYKLVPYLKFKCSCFYGHLRGCMSCKIFCFSNMSFNAMFVSAVCILLLIKLLNC